MALAGVPPVGVRMRQFLALRLRTYSGGGDQEGHPSCGVPGFYWGSFTLGFPWWFRW